VSTVQVPDAVMDAVVAEPLRVDRSDRSVGRLTGPREARIPIGVFKVFGWRDLLYLAGGVRDQMGIDLDDAGFRYPGDELDPGEEPFDDVEVYNPIGEVFVTIPAFERLAARYFRALVDGVASSQDPVAYQPCWPEFVAATEEIERRVQSH